MALLAGLISQPALADDVPEPPPFVTFPPGAAVCYSIPAVLTMPIERKYGPGGPGCEFTTEPMFFYSLEVLGAVQYVGDYRVTYVRAKMISLQNAGDPVEVFSIWSFTERPVL